MRTGFLEGNKLTLAVLSVSVIAGIGLFVAFNQVDTYDSTQEFQPNVTVIESDNNVADVGFDVGDDMRFGELVLGTNMTRRINMGTDRTTYVETGVEGNISEGLEIDDKVLEKDDFELVFKYITNRSGTGYFEGNMTLEIHTAENMWEELWLKTLYRLP